MHNKENPASRGPAKTPFKMTYEGNRARDVRDFINILNQDLKRSMFERITPQMVPLDAPEEARAAFVEQLKEAIKSGEIKFSPLLIGQDYFKLDTNSFRGDKELAKKTFTALCKDEKIESTISNGSVLFESSHDEAQHFLRLLLGLKMKQMSLRDYSR